MSASKILIYKHIRCLPKKHINTTRKIKQLTIGSYQLINAGLAYAPLAIICKIELLPDWGSDVIEVTFRNGTTLVHEYYEKHLYCDKLLPTEDSAEFVQPWGLRYICV